MTEFNFCYIYPEDCVSIKRRTSVPSHEDIAERVSVTTTKINKHSSSQAKNQSKTVQLSVQRYIT